MSKIIVKHGTATVELDPVVDEVAQANRTFDGSVAHVVPTVANYSLEDLERAVEAVKRAVQSDS